MDSSNNLNHVCKFDYAFWGLHDTPQNDFRESKISGFVQELNGNSGVLRLEPLNGKAFARLASSSTYGDLNRLLAYFYLRVDRLQRIIFFSRKATSEDNNKNLFGCLMITDKESVLLDTACLTGERQPREYEIISLFKHIHGNGHYNKIELITKKIPATGDLSVEEACNIVTNNPTEEVIYENILIFLGLIRGSLYGAEPSQYLFDDEIGTLKLVIENVLKDLDDITFEFKENNFLISIGNQNTFSKMYNMLFQSLVDLYGEPEASYFKKYDEVKNQHIKIDLPKKLSSFTYKISIENVDGKYQIENF